MTHRILLADDSVTIRKVVGLTFSDEDFTIDAVGDGVQAFEHASAQRPDIIISDVSMPGMNGYELCQKIKTDPGLSSVPFLFLKGAFESYDEDQARSCGADGFIVKPFESQEMIARVKEMIAKAAQAPAVAPSLPIQEPAAPRAAASAVPVPAPPPVPAAPVSSPRPVTAPPPPAPALPAAPTVAARPVPAPPVVPPARMPPVPPTPKPWRVAAPAPPPARPVPPEPVRTAPPVPPVPPRPTRPIAEIPHAAASQTWEAPQPAPVEDFGFDFGETDTDVVAPHEQHHAAAPRPAAPHAEPDAESEEDLWSEVSLRNHLADPLGTQTQEASVDWFGNGTQAGPEEPPTESADENVFAEVDPLQRTPQAEQEPERARTFTPTPAPTMPESVTAVSGTPVEVDPAQIESIVAARMEAAVRQVLEPVVKDLARAMIESVAWEVVPELAEAMIRAEIERISQSTRTD